MNPLPLTAILAICYSAAMKTGLISDTHAPAMGAVPPIEVERAFADVDLILHAGDIYSPECLDWLERIAPLYAVEVYPSLAWGDPRVERKRVIEINGHRVGLVHELIIEGYGMEVVPGAIGRQLREGDWLPDIMAKFFGEPVDAVIFGDTHVPVIEEHQGILFVNPGSPTLPRQTRGLGHVAILESTAEGHRAEVLDLRDFREPTGGK